jgi:hypothetical protein
LKPGGQYDRHNAEKEHAMMNLIRSILSSAFFGFAFVLTAVSLLVMIFRDLLSAAFNQAFAGFLFTGFVFILAAFFFRFFKFEGRVPFSGPFARVFGFLGVVFAFVFGVGVFFAFLFNENSFAALFPTFKAFFASFFLMFALTVFVSLAFRNFLDDETGLSVN